MKKREIISVCIAIVVCLLLITSNYNINSKSSYVSDVFASAKSEKRSNSISNKESADNITNTKDEKYRIEHVRAVMPYVKAYFYPDKSFDVNKDISAYLGDDNLNKVSCSPFSDAKESIDYYFLIDNSKSVEKSDFEDTKTEIIEATSKMDKNDTISIYLVGDYAEKLAEKISAKDTEKITEILDGIERDGMNTNLYNAIKDTATEIAGDSGEKVYDSTNYNEYLDRNRSVIVAVTDGVNDTENGYGKDETITKLQSNNIPLYLIQQKMQGGNGGESRADIQQVVRQTGGEYLITEDFEEKNIVEQLIKRLNSCYVAVFESESNEASNTELDFNIEYETKDGAKSFNPKKVMVERHITDDESPKVTDIKITNEHTINVYFSKNVSETAKNLSLYSITDERENSIKPTGADFDVDRNDVVILTTSDKLWNGKYTIEISSGITDLSQEKNEVTPIKKEIEFTGGEDFVEVKESFFQKYWWILMICFVLIVVITLIIIYAAIKKRKGLVVVDDQIVMADKVEKKTHVQIIKEQSPVPSRSFNTRKLTFVICSGGQLIKEISKDIEGSMIIGRSDICDIYIDDLQLSRQHFAIEESGNELYIMDLDTKNGTYLNGVKINEKRKLEKEDRIKAGNLEIIIRW